MVTNFFMVVPYICVSSVYDLLHVTLLVPRVFEVAVKFLKMCAVLYWGTHLYS